MASNDILYPFVPYICSWIDSKKAKGHKHGHESVESKVVPSFKKAIIVIDQSKFEENPR